jgi:hypothetical protein
VTIHRSKCFVAEQLYRGSTTVTVTIRNEKRKLSATWCNTLATAALTAGTFAPLAAIFYGLANFTIEHKFFYLMAVVCAVAGFALHLLGRGILGRLE